MSKGERTKVVLVDAAEQLFAEHGFDGVSMRDVAVASGALIGLLTYHFPTKEMLFEAVVDRRADQLNTLRLDTLAAMRRPNLEAVLIAFTRPYLDLISAGDIGWKHYARLIAHVSQDSRWAELGDRLFGETARVFIEKMEAAQPGLTHDDAVRSYVHVVAVMMSVYASTGLLDRFSKGAMRSDDVAASFEPMIQFLVGGIKAYATARRKTTRSTTAQPAKA